MAFFVVNYQKAKRDLPLIIMGKDIVIIPNLAEPDALRIDSCRITALQMAFLFYLLKKILKIHSLFYRVIFKECQTSAFLL